MIKLSHETPKSLLKQSLLFNDFQYCLPHLMEENEEYRNHFLKCKEDGVEIFLDNSLHELGFALNDNILLKWIKILEPSTFFVPDVWEKDLHTLNNAYRWIEYKNKFPKTTLTPVIQATSLKDIEKLYREYKRIGYDKVAFSYGNSVYERLFPYPNKDLAKSFGRLQVLSYLYNEEVIKENDRIHLLGLSTTFELQFLNQFPFIESLDSSSPIMAALDGTEYGENGIYTKPKSNMNDCFDTPIEDINLELLDYNINKFKELLQ